MQTSLIALTAGVEGYGKVQWWPPRDFIEEDRQRRERLSFAAFMERLRLGTPGLEKARDARVVH